MMNFLSQVKGVIHVGAHTGQERDLYAAHDLDVLWIEPNPDVFWELDANLLDYPKQVALRYLITDKDNELYVLNLASNHGGSSSIFEFAKHAQAFPDIKYQGEIELRSRTLDSLPTKLYDALVLDVQGAELLVLKGAVETLKHMRFVQMEAYSEEMYAGGATPKDLRDFMTSQGFREIEDNAWDLWDDLGKGYELVFERVPDGRQ